MNTKRTTQKKTVAPQTASATATATAKVEQEQNENAINYSAFSTPGNSSEDNLLKNGLESGSNFRQIVVEDLSKITTAPSLKSNRGLNLGPITSGEESKVVRTKFRPTLNPNLKLRLDPGTDVIKLFTAVNYDFS